MDWSTEHWRGWLTGTGLGALLLILLRVTGGIDWLIKRLVSVPKAIHATDAELLSGSSQLVVLRTTQRDDALANCKKLEAEVEQLANDLKEETRKVLLREQINSEDTRYIRAVTRRLREKGIDYADINTEFRRND